MEETKEEVVVSLTFDELMATAGTEVQGREEAIERAFGSEGLGILAVTDVPGLQEQRVALLPLARRLAQFEDSVKKLYEHEESFYSVGWSHGKEKLQGGMPDFSKGSFYANPLYDKPFEDKEIIKSQPSFAEPNIWPTTHLPELEEAFKALGRTIVDVGLLIAEQCDRYIDSHYGEGSGFLHSMIQESRCCKARLLHYFPLSPELVPERGSQPNTMCQPEAQSAQLADWCGWHNDHGALTGLVPGLYLDDSSGAVVECTESEAGLFICNRQGDIVKPKIPQNALLFQIGETSQVLSGGLLQATPHAVRAGTLQGISRESFAVFMEPEWTYPMRCCSVTRDEEAKKIDGQKTETYIDIKSRTFQETDFSQLTGMSPLSARWQPNMTFGLFTQNTLEAYH